jgi:hypothetical protein
VAVGPDEVLRGLLRAEPRERAAVVVVQDAWCGLPRQLVHGHELAVAFPQAADLVGAPGGVESAEEEVERNRPQGLVQPALTPVADDRRSGSRSDVTGASKAVHPASSSRLNRVTMRVRARSPRFRAGGFLASFHPVVSMPFPGLTADTARRRSGEHGIVFLPWKPLTPLIRWVGAASLDVS